MQPSQKNGPSVLAPCDAFFFYVKSDQRDQWNTVSSHTPAQSKIQTNPSSPFDIIPLLKPPLGPTAVSVGPKMQKPVAVPTPQIPKTF